MDTSQISELWERFKTPIVIVGAAVVLVVAFLLFTGGGSADEAKEQGTAEPGTATISNSRQLTSDGRQVDCFTLSSPSEGPISLSCIPAQ